jgi:hypothetical protein
MERTYTCELCGYVAVSEWTDDEAVRHATSDLIVTSPPFLALRSYLPTGIDDEGPA